MANKNSLTGIQKQRFYYAGVSLVVEWLNVIELLIINRQNILLLKIADEQNTLIHNLYLYLLCLAAFCV